MAYVGYKCLDCGGSEYPMRHAYNGCNGKFVWDNNDHVRCLRCDDVYPINIKYWCGWCRRPHYNFDLS